MGKINSQKFTNIHFVQNNGIAVSTTAIYGSNNGGESWQQRSNYGNPLWVASYDYRRNIGMDSAGNIIVAQGLNNKSTTGYSLALSNDYNDFTIVPDNFIINDVCFVKNNIAYAITANEQDTEIHFLRTTDGGRSWNRVSNLPRIDTVFRGQIGYTRLSFINSQVGWVSTHYGMFKTTNGGLTWLHQYQPLGNIINISAIDVNTCYIQFVGSIPALSQEIHKISKTTDGGTTWREVFSAKTGGFPSLGPSIQAFQFVNANTGYMVRGQWIYKSTDGGVNWSKVVSIHSSLCSFTDIYFTDANNGWACSSEGQIVRYKL
jgi:photosystem II stability/assembly factor-like uncharacterized protein